MQGLACREVPLRRMMRFGLAALALLMAVAEARAQVPPHPPGTICFTFQGFWCWASPPGPPGFDCACPSPMGWVPGKLG